MQSEFDRDISPEELKSKPAPEKPQKAPTRQGGSGLWVGGCALAAALAVLGVIVVAVVGVIFLIGAAFIGESMPAFEKLAPIAMPHNFTEEYVSGDYFSSKKIAVIDIYGVISSSEGSLYEIASSELICEQLRGAADDASIKAIVVNLDTPGGEVTASDAIYHEIMEIRNSTRKPVVAMMNSLAASGGYYVAAGCDRIVANKLTLTGSIGVIIESYNYSELFNKVGLKSEIYKSGAMKDMLDGSRPRTEEERRVVQQLVDNTYNEFVSVVSLGRNIPAEKIKGTYMGDGRVLDGKQALACNLVDKLGYFQDSIAEAAKLANIESYKVVRFKEAFSFAKLLEQMNGSSASLKVSLPGLSAEPRLQKGRLYFLPPNY